MLKKIAFGIVWFVVLYIGICMVGGFILAARISPDDYASVEAHTQACREAGYEAGVKYGGYILAFSALLAAIGSIAGVLPGTGGYRRDTHTPSPLVKADERPAQSRGVSFPPWSVHFIVPGLVLASGSPVFFCSDTPGTTGLMILTLAIVFGIICSGGLILYERCFGPIKN
jgi:hypothetical protein